MITRLSRSLPTVTQTQLLQCRHKLWIFVARDRNQVAILTRFTPDDLGQPDRRIAIGRAIVPIDSREQRTHFIEEPRRDRLRQQRPASARSAARNTATVTDHLAEKMSAVDRQ